MSNSGVVSRVAGQAIGADAFLPNMGIEAFLVCLSRQALETAAKHAEIEPRARVRETRAALVDHFNGDASLLHPSALFAPDPKDIADLIRHADHAGEAEDGASDIVEDNPVEDEAQPGIATDGGGFDDKAGTLDDQESAYGIAAE